MTQKWSKTERNQTDFPFVLADKSLAEWERVGGKRDTWKHVARSVTGVRRSMGSKGHVSFNLLLRKRIITVWSSALCFVGSLTKFQTQPNYKWEPLWVVHEAKVARNNERRWKLKIRQVLQRNDLGFWVRWLEKKKKCIAKRMCKDRQALCPCGDGKPIKFT